MLAQGDIFVALPGGVGTLDEIFTMLLPTPSATIQNGDSLQHERLLELHHRLLDDMQRKA